MADRSEKLSDGVGKHVKRAYAKALYQRAMAHLQTSRPDLLQQASKVGPRTLKRMRARKFLEHYCWVVYASGFRFQTVEEKFPHIRKAFCDFELARLARKRSVKPALEVFNNYRKAASCLAGATAIASEGFGEFKERVAREGISALESLPGVGPVTKFHLGKNIGLVDKAKPDIWLVRAAELCNATVDELVEFLSQTYGVSQHVVDLALWHYGAMSNFGRAAERSPHARCTTHA